MALTIYTGASLRVMTMLALSAAATFLALVMFTKIITGEESIIYYHHEIAVIAVAGILLKLFGQPVVPYLDVTILGIGMFLFCGRIGCLMAGCCHGRPNSWGIRYREEHREAGFTPYLVGVRLFPIQAVESLWVLCIVVTGFASIMRGRQPGTALAWYVIAYGTGRFCFEFLRGDPDRSYFWGFSQPQWISLLLMCAVAWGELSGVLTLQLWHVFAAIGLAMAMAATSLRRRFQRADKHRLLHPNHIKEVAGIIESVSPPATRTSSHFQWTVLPGIDNETIRVGCTSLGLQLSAGYLSPGAGDIYHYSISFRGGAMSRKQAEVITRLILRLRRVEGSIELRQGSRGVFHLLIDPQGAVERQTI